MLISHTETNSLPYIPPNYLLLTGTACRSVFNRLTICLLLQDKWILSLPIL